MKISARNRLKGKIVEVKKGVTTAHVRLDVNGLIVTASITNEAVDELGLKVGQDAYAIIKASDVMVGLDGSPDIVTFWAVLLPAKAIGLGHLSRRLVARRPFDIRQAR